MQKLGTTTVHSESSLKNIARASSGHNNSINECENQDHRGGTNITGIKEDAWIGGWLMMSVDVDRRWQDCTDLDWTAVENWLVILIDKMTPTIHRLCFLLSCSTLASLSLFLFFSKPPIAASNLAKFSSLYIRTAEARSSLASLLLLNGQNSDFNADSN